MKIKWKIILCLIITFTVGFSVGVFTVGFIIKRKFQEISQKGFSQAVSPRINTFLIKRLDLDENQKIKIKNIVQNTTLELEKQDQEKKIIIEKSIKQIQSELNEKQKIKFNKMVNKWRKTFRPE